MDADRVEVLEALRGERGFVVVVTAFGVEDGAVDDRDADEVREIVCPGGLLDLLPQRDGVGVLAGRACNVRELVERRCLAVLVADLAGESRRLSRLFPRLEWLA